MVVTIHLNQRRTSKINRAERERERVQRIPIAAIAAVSQGPIWQLQILLWLPQPVTWHSASQKTCIRGSKQPRSVPFGSRVHWPKMSNRTTSGSTEDSYNVHIIRTQIERSGNISDFGTIVSSLTFFLQADKVRLWIVFQLDRHNQRTLPASSFSLINQIARSEFSISSIWEIADNSASKVWSDQWL